MRSRVEHFRRRWKRSTNSEKKNRHGCLIASDVGYSTRMKQPLFIVVPSVALLLAVACGDSSPTSTDPTVGGSSGTSGASGNPPGSSGVPGSSGTPPGSSGNPGEGGPTTGTIKGTVFVIMMENHSWGTIKNSGSAAYINGLAAKGGHAEQYHTPAGNHPSEPNYIWIEAGDNLGITDDNPPADNHQSTKDHLTAQLDAKGITWKAYSEDITAGKCPLTTSGLYDPKHTPQLFFDDVTDTNKSDSKYCIDHVVPYTQLATDIAANAVPRYAFITPNLCNDMHGETFGTNCGLGSDTIKKGNDWLSVQLPKILASTAYTNNGVVFLVWDEGDPKGFPPKSEDGPIPFFVLSPLAKPGYVLNTKVTHSALLRTIETIFGVPFLRGAQTAPDLAEMFTSFP
jgi:hypothetical protein